MEDMDIDTFIDELEIVCGCPDTGYIKCLEKVKELKKEIEDWKNIDMGLLESEYMMGKNSEIFELKKKNEKLKKENDAMRMNPDSKKRYSVAHIQGLTERERKLGAELEEAHFQELMKTDYWSEGEW